MHLTALTTPPFRSASMSSQLPRGGSCDDVRRRRSFLEGPQVMLDRFGRQRGFSQGLPNDPQKFRIIHGFWRKAFAPALSARSLFARTSRADTTITGITARAGKDNGPSWPLEKLQTIT
jgi:hypothetical protein